MSIIKRLKWKDKSGKTTDYDLGAKASNVEQDATHRFVSDMEKQTWNGKADPGDIPSGAAADYGVANNDTTNRADMLSTAQVAYQHGKEIDQLNSEFADRLQGDVRIIPEGSGADTKYYAQVGADAASKKLLGNPMLVKAGAFTAPGFGADGHYDVELGTADDDTIIIIATWTDQSDYIKAGIAISSAINDRSAYQSAYGSEATTRNECTHGENSYFQLLNGGETLRILRGNIAWSNFPAYYMLLKLDPIIAEIE